MVRDKSCSFEEVAVLIKTELERSHLLTYVPRDAIKISNPGEKDTIPEFQSYIIRVFPADSGFIDKQPKIGRYYRNTYVVAIELWVKSGSSVGERLLLGNNTANKGIFEFLQDVSDTLEHNTFDGQLDPFPGTNIINPVVLSSDDKLIEGIGFIWMGNQDNIK